MATTTPSYYELLGLQSNATSTQITSAYRRLAKKLHPDTPTGDAERFKQISEAYETLSDPDRRRSYDEAQLTAPSNHRDNYDFNPRDPFVSSYDFSGPSGSPFRRSSGFFDFGDIFVDMPEQPSPRVDLEMTMDLSFAQAVRGYESTLDLQVPIVCPDCSSSPGSKCATCLSTRSVTVPLSVKVRIPSATNDGATLKVRLNEAHRHPEWNIGDLYLHVKVTPEPNLTLAGRDLITSATVTAVEAMLGSKATLSILGDLVSIKIPPGTQPNAVLRVHAKGVPADRHHGPGDLLVRVIVTIPRRLTRVQKDRVHALAESLDKS